MDDRICQSCGMPLAHDTLGGGTEANGEHTQKFCSQCYRGGKFTNEHMSAKDMAAFVDERLKEQEIGWLKRWYFTKQIPKLERWKK